MAEIIGTVHPLNTMFMREAVGTAAMEDGRYELTIGVGGGIPLIRSEQTGRFWSISWQELVRLAIAAGIDQKE